MKIKEIFCMHTWSNADKFTKKKYKRTVNNKSVYVHAYCIKCRLCKTLRLNKLKESTIKFDENED